MVALRAVKAGQATAVRDDFSGSLKVTRP